MVKKLRIGMVDLDTSHPENWLPIIRRMGHDVVAVLDSRTVYPADYCRDFAQKHDIAQVYDSLDLMAEAVDVAIIHSCDWDSHIDKARPFAEAGKAILIDKPIAGNLSDLLQLREWDKQGIRIFGGSALRWCQELQDWQHQHHSSDIVFAYAGCSVDEFNYGIHAYSLLHGIMGAGIEWVRYLGSHIQHQVEIGWKDGRRGQVGVGETNGYLPIYATITTGTTVSHLQVDGGNLYATLLEAVLPCLAEDVPFPIPLSALIEVEMAAIAARISRLSGGKVIRLQDLLREDEGYDGSVFAAAYRQQKMTAKQ
jgi:hypothetical protein